MVSSLLCLLGALTLGTTVATPDKAASSGDSKSTGDVNDAVSNYLGPESEPLVNVDTNNEEALEEWKRAAHRLMHFGKRDPDQVRNLFDLSSIQAELNEGKRGSHRMMHFGKREPDQLHFKQDDTDKSDDPKKMDKEEDDSKTEDESYEKRSSHRLMHFGKRDEEKRAGHKMMHFGKREEEDKRGGHKMMHFGKRDEEPDGLDIKRAGHKMMHFGKRQEGEDKEEEVEGENEKRGHKMMHFGKRDEEAQEFAYEDDYYKRAGHKMMHFGKREDEDEKRVGHKMMHFGKKSDLAGQGQQDVSGTSTSPAPAAAPRRTTRSVAPFFYDPYRSRDLLDLIQRLYREDAKRGHNIMRFGKRRPEGSYYEGDSYPEAPRGGSPHHSLLHFGKRYGPDVMDLDDDFTDDEHDERFDGFDDDFEFDPSEMEKTLPDPIMPFGKRQEPWLSERELRQRLEDYKRGHSLLHFGKRFADGPYEKRPQHTIMHFGKRSVDFPVERLRLKRSAPGGSPDLRSLLWHPAVETGYLLPHALSAAEVGTLHVPMFVGQLNRIQRAAYPYYNLPKAEKKEHRNIYLHFG